MKILFVTECYHPTINGVVIAMDSFARQLHKKGHQVFFLAPHNYSYKDKSHRVYRVPSLPLGREQDYFLTFPGQITLETIKMIDPDIIHTHHIWIMGRLALKASRLLKVPLVVTYHAFMEAYVHKIKGVVAIPGVKQLLQGFIRQQSRVFCNQADLVISPSFAMKKIIRSYKIKTPIEVLATGIDLKDFKFHNKNYLLSKHRIKEKGARLLLFVGRLAFEKNISMLLRAFQKINRALPHTYLIFLGSGPQADLYRRQTESLGIKDKVIMPGFVDPREAKKYFGSVDLFVFPSITETQGIVILEAMAGGAVPVAVNKLGPTDIINPDYNGVLVPNNPQRFSQAVLKLLGNPALLNKMKKNGIKRAQAFTIQKQTDKLVGLYRQLIE
jgi:glycosyltransferase involved in cell wall biosynthesis